MENRLEVLTNRISEPRRTKPFREEGQNASDNNLGQALEKIDFKYYSMSPSTSAKLEGRERGGLKISREILAEPSREISLNFFHVASHLVTLHENDLVASEQYDMLALRLIAGTTEKLFKRVLITSAQKGDGRTSVLINLAGALARAGKRVLVIDTDFVKPSVIRLLGIESQIGLAEIYGRGLPPGAAIVRVLPSDFHVLPMRERIDNSVEILTSPIFHEILEILDPNYDFILFDSPPMLDRADCSMLIKLVDTALVVVRQGATKVATMAKAVEQLSQEDIFGVVLNRITDY
ncbi:MAG: CpsD/CapB family tyrosine-protein kinase [Acidobacteria bacterium]|nr:CpsD/CapB family tyrosine-protein kinase [Acidobacteriota bacterium]